MDNSNEFEDDPPTVVASTSAPVVPVVNRWIDVGLWKFVPSGAQRTVLRLNQVLAWFAIL